MTKNWVTSFVDGSKRRQVGDASALYRKVRHGVWQVFCFQNGNRVSVRYATTERHARRMVNEWVSIPF